MTHKKPATYGECTNRQLIYGFTVSVLSLNFHFPLPPSSPNKTTTHHSVNDPRIVNSIDDFPLDSKRSHDQTVNYYCKIDSVVGFAVAAVALYENRKTLT